MSRTAPKVVDARRDKDDRSYRLECVCSNCGALFIVQLSWGRNRPSMSECPECGSHAHHNWGGLA